MGISGPSAIKSIRKSDCWPHSNLLLIKQVSLKFDVGLKPSSYHQCMTIITSFMIFLMFIRSLIQSVRETVILFNWEINWNWFKWLESCEFEPVFLLCFCVMLLFFIIFIKSLFFHWL